MGTCVVRKVISPEEIKNLQKQKRKRRLNGGLQFLLFGLLFVMLVLCVGKWGMNAEKLAIKFVIPNLCFPWWGMTVVLFVTFIGLCYLNQKDKNKPILNIVTLLLLFAGTFMFYFNLFYLSTAVIFCGNIVVLVKLRSLNVKQKVSFLPIFVLLCYVGLVVYFFALIN